MENPFKDLDVALIHATAFLERFELSELNAAQFDSYVETLGKCNTYLAIVRSKYSTIETTGNSIRNGV